MSDTNLNKFLSIQHISFVISNLESSLAFYNKILELKVDETRPNFSFDGCWLTINETQQIHLLLVDNYDPIKRPEHGGRDRHAAFKVRDLEQFAVRLDSNNITYTLSKSGRKALFVRDPDGNTLELIQ